MATYFRRGKTWAVAYRLKGCKRQYLYGIRSEKLARHAKSKKDQEEQLARAGLFTPDPAADRLAAAQRKPLPQHIVEFEGSIVARGKNKQHTQQQAAHVRRLLRMARIGSLSEIDVELVQQTLARLRKTVSPRTCNAARAAVIQFERWLQKANRIRHCVLEGLARFNEEEDIRRARRALSQEEVDWLLSTTTAATDWTSRRCGINPADRAMLYAVGLATGFRRKALLSLNKTSFVVGEVESQPMVRLAAAQNKKRRDFSQMIPLSLTSQLRHWLAGKEDRGPVWRPSPHADLSLRFRRDMEAARAAWIAAGVDAEERSRRAQSHTLQYVYHDGVRNVFADFHSLRHTGISFVTRTAGLRVAQTWADHSTPVLTARYAHVESGELQAVLNAVPNTDCAGRDRDPAHRADVTAPAATREPEGRKRAVQRAGKSIQEKFGRTWTIRHPQIGGPNGT